MVFEGDVRAGEAFRKEFSPGLEFFLEPLRSGWIARVLEVRQKHEVRETHDWAEVATPPFRSVSPLLISTDWAFRAQDAGAWNPRLFRFAADRKTFLKLAALEERVLRSDASATSEMANLLQGLPEASFRMLNIELVPGTRDQTMMAAAVASHWAETPHQAVSGGVPSALGRLERLQFRVRIPLPKGGKPTGQVQLQQFSCGLQPTG